jgi:hypothetical protein
MKIGLVKTCDFLEMIGVGKGEALPALRTVRAVLPHTALQSVVSSSGLARQNVGITHGEKPLFSEESILRMVINHPRIMSWNVGIIKKRLNPDSTILFQDQGMP